MAKKFAKDTELMMLSLQKMMTKIILHKGKEMPLLRQHPWVFSGAIKITEGEAKDGDTVEVFSADKKFLGIGHYQVQNSITVRIISFEPFHLGYHWSSNKDVILVCAKKK
jgi:23S rRNA (cytosine1962-C5)-methyltransferase